MSSTSKFYSLGFSTLLFLTGCGAANQGMGMGMGMGMPGTNTAPSSQLSVTATDDIPRYLEVTQSSYDSSTRAVKLLAKSATDADIRGTGNKETIVDTENLDGIVNYATALHPDRPVERVRVSLQRQAPTQGDFINLPVRKRYGMLADEHGTGGTATAARTTRVESTAQAGSQMVIPPSGVRMDPHIRALASTSASYSAKVDAIRRVGESKLGTPYIWGHNEDRGQYGFDCSNFTEYVFHHALGYSFTTSSRGQYRYVGLNVPASQMRAGDLICFRQGAHVGIYMGGGQMLQMGGGTAKCTYLPLRPGSFWYKEISAVKRMF